MADVNMNAEHRQDFQRAERGMDAMEGLHEMLESYPLDGVPIELGDHVLEIGAAFGSMTVLLKDEVDRVTAVETDPDMANEASARLAGTNAEVLNASATELPVDDDTFSASVCVYVLHHVPSPGLQDRVLAEAVRILRPGGVFLGWDSLNVPEIVRYHEGDVFVPVDLETFPDRLRAAGFTVIRVEPADEGATIRFAARVTP